MLSHHSVMFVEGSEGWSPHVQEQLWCDTKGFIPCDSVHHMEPLWHHCSTMVPSGAWLKLSLSWTWSKPEVSSYPPLGFLEL